MKILKTFVCIISAFSLLLLSSCGIIEKVENTVTFPDSYSITYEITTAEGLIHTVTKTVDASGNVYLGSKEGEQLFLNENGTYTLYKRNDGGSFAKVEGAKYTKEAMERELSPFDAYAMQTTNKHIPTARRIGETAVAEREVDTYRLGVNLLAVSFYHVYYVDRATGVCLGVDVVNTVFGNETKDNEETFICTEYKTENIEDLKTKFINK